MASTTARTTTASSLSPPNSTTAMPIGNSDESIMLSIGIALLRSKLLSQPLPQPQLQPLTSYLSSSHNSRWKQKAKDRKQEILRLKEEIKHLEDDLRGDLYPKSASCKCYFFNDLIESNPKQLNHGSNHRLSDVLRRRFLRQVRLHKRFKTTASNSSERRDYTELCIEEDVEQINLSADFLVDLCETPNPVETRHFTNLAHQAVDFILGSLNQVLSSGKDVTVIEGVISSLIVHLVKRMCTPLADELYCDPETDAQIHIQHIIRQLGSHVYVGQRILLSVCHRISEEAEILLSLDPFHDSFALIHDSMFVMIQLIEFLVSDYLITWSNDSDFDIKLFEEWTSSFLQARNALQAMEKRSGIYALYMDRVTGELARQLGQVSLLHKLNQDTLDNLFT